VLSIFRKNKALNSVYIQMLVIVAAFVIMGISSFFFVGSIERKHLIMDAESALAFTEAELISTFNQYEVFLNSYSETIRNMILWGEDENTIYSYMVSTTNFMLNQEDYMEDLYNTHGNFLKWGGKFISSKTMSQPADTIPQDRPCFTAAVKEDGKIVISELYTSSETGSTIISFSRYIKDNESNPLGVICIDFDLQKINRFANSLNLTEHSYGIILNSNHVILTHPEPFYIGQNIADINSGVADLSNELKLGLDVYERKLKNYMQESSIVYFRKVKYDWYIGIVIPVYEYYGSLYIMGAFLTVIGSLLAAVLCFMLFHISQAKMKSDLKTQQKSSFLATMSHEIRTPLNAILGMTDIQMQNNAHPPSTSEAFIKINNSGNLLLNIINDILDLSKIETGKLELVPVKYEVASLINDIVQLNYIRYDSKPIEFVLEIDENIPSKLIGDELRIKQILNNLLSNAFKYTNHGSVTLGVSAECVTRGGTVLVTLIFRISDTGHGMTQDQISKIYDENTWINLEANRTTEGAGLGMTITRNLVSLMYGNITVKSEIDKGTSVTVRLPQKTDGKGIRGILGKELAENLRQFKQGNIIQLKKSQVSYEYMPYGSILIVDDVETNLFVAKGLMAPYGIKIDLATSGFEAIEKVKQGNIYDIIFMDHMMPKLDGIETTKMLRGMGYTNPVVALTANAIAGQAEVFLKNGFDGFISKPIDIRQLNVTLNRLIRDKYPADVIKAAQKEKIELEKKQGTSFGHQDLDRQLAEIFARDAKKAAGSLEICLQNNFQSDNDIHMYIINVHAMKSALANIGEKELSGIALRLEQAGREKDLNVIVSETRGFLNRLQKVINEIKSKYQEENSEDTEESLVFLREKLAIIKEACAAFDKKTTKNTLADLREKTWSQDTKELINSIAEHLLHSEFDDAVNLADSYLNKT